MSIDFTQSAELDEVREAHRSERAPRALRERLLERLVRQPAPAASALSKLNAARLDGANRGRLWAALGAAALVGGLWLSASRAGLLSARPRTGVEVAPEPAASSDRRALPDRERVNTAGPPQPVPAPAALTTRPCPLQEVESGSFVGDLRFARKYALRPGAAGWHTLQMATPSCGPLERYYVEVAAKKPVARSPAPVLILIHDSGKNVQQLTVDETRGYFDDLALDGRVILILAQAAPGRKTSRWLEGSGGWQTDDGAHPQVDDEGYLRRVLEDLKTRGVIAGGNPVWLVGHGGGAALALAAAAHHPELYSAVAAYKPSRLDLPLPRPSEGARLRRAFFIVDEGDAWSAPLLGGIAAEWAVALGVPGDIARGRSPEPSERAAGVRQFDVGAAGGATPGVRVITLGAQGDLFPAPGGGDPLVLAASRARPSFINGAEELWAFFQR
jgi:pimeloyl-ACP methyl ester carboxylesterase